MTEKEQQEQQSAMAEELMQQLRSKATELLLREEWEASIRVYTQFINLGQEISKIHQHPHQDDESKLRKSLCLALCNRAEAQCKMRDLEGALKDCDEALKIESTHFKTLLCKGKILLALNRYSSALDCFKLALLDSQASGNSESLNGYFEKCKKLEFQSKAGVFDLSDWVVQNFGGKSPDLAEYIGPVQIKTSEISGRGLFVTKNIDAGTLLLVTKAVAIERGILSGDNSGEKAQLVMWKNFIDKVIDSAGKSQRIRSLLSTLSDGENENGLQVPDINHFRPEAEVSSSSTEKLEMGKVLSILDVNSLVEDAASAKVLGKNSEYYGVGLWMLTSFINHSCIPNARRLHVGDHVIVHASRDIKAGEEITFAYFDALVPLAKRREMSQSWGFQCNCRRCKFEEGIYTRPEIREIEIGIERGIDLCNAVYRVEEVLKRWVTRGKEKGYVRADFWSAYSGAYGSERSMRWGRKIPPMETVVDSVVETVGNDERVLRMVVGKLKRSGGGTLEMERAMKMAKGVYGKVVKKQALKTLLEHGFTE